MAGPIAKNGKPPVDTDRRRQLVQIAFDLIASKGFEGLRFQQVAAQAGINNATLYYYFASKEALIQGVVEYMMAELKTPPVEVDKPPCNALEELRQMFEEARRRLKGNPSFFIVITELALRAKRDPAIDRIGEDRDKFWVNRFTGIVERGVAQGIFRSELDREATAASLMIQMKGLAHHAAMRERTPGEIDAILSTLAAQIEHWLTCGNSRSVTPKTSNSPYSAQTVGNKRRHK